MKVSHTLSRDDVWGFNRFHLYRKKKLLHGVEALGSTVLTLSWLFLSWHIIHRVLIFEHFLGWTPFLWQILLPTEQRLGLCWLLLTAYMAYSFWGSKWLALYREVPGKLLAEPKTMRLTAAGVQVVTPAQQSSLAWNAISEVAGDSRCLYLYTSATNAVVVPRRAFPSRAQAAAFEEAAPSFKADPHATSAPVPFDVWPPPPSRATSSIEPPKDDAEKDDAPGTRAVSYVTRRAYLWRSALLLACRRPASLLNIFLSCLFTAAILVLFSRL